MLPKQNPTKAIPFDPSLPFEIALGFMPVDEVFRKHKVSEEQQVELLKSTAFVSAVQQYVDEFQSTGLTFRLKASVQASQLLDTLWEMVHDEEVSSTTRLEAIRSVVKWAGLEPSNTKPSDTPAFSLVINLPGSTEPVTLTAERVDAPPNH